jgi:hypothetical protein
MVMTSSIQQRGTPLHIENITTEEDVFSKLCNDDHLSLTEAPDAIQTPLYE